MYEPVLNERQRRIDWALLTSLLGLMVIGVAFIYSATSVQESISRLPWYRQYYFLQILWFGLGLGAAFGFCLVDYHVWARWSLVLYWAMVAMLVAVLIPGIGALRFGARRWIDLGIFQFQPSEFSKLAFIFAQAHFLSRPAEELRQPAVFWKGIGMILLPFVLILREPDLGSALVLLPVGLVTMYVAGVPVAFLRRLMTGATILIALLLVDILFMPPGWWQIKVQDYQRRRLLVYFGREDSYNVRQAMISVGAGGLTGKGWRQGAQTVLGFLPRGVAHNDFIFSVIAEEKGFIGSVTVLALYTMVLFTGLRTASRARDRLGKLLAVGVVTLLFSHVFINIGMNIRIMPVTGIPLPLLSYGGSSVLCSLIATGILQNVYYYRNSY
ncbi:MAG: rod shape-determining protein RodA [Candidatus Omnitrophica bacterium]|nr:rod shape-determining protein RodA [Candidatus Omnitrophota bacterium]